MREHIKKDWCYDWLYSIDVSPAKYRNKIVSIQKKDTAGKLVFVESVYKSNAFLDNSISFFFVVTLCVNCFFCFPYGHVARQRDVPNDFQKHKIWPAHAFVSCATTPFVRFFSLV